MEEALEKERAEHASISGETTQKLEQSLEEFKAKCLTSEKLLEESESSKKALCEELEELKKQLVEVQNKASEASAAASTPVDNTEAIAEAVGKALEEVNDKHEKVINAMKTEVSELTDRSIKVETANDDLKRKNSELETAVANAVAAAGDSSAEKPPIKVKQKILPICINFSFLFTHINPSRICTLTHTTCPHSPI